MKAVVIGSGGFGTAMAIALSRGGVEVALWARDPQAAATIAASRRNDRYLEGVEIPAAVQVTGDAASAFQAADVALVAVPTQHVRSTLSALSGQIPAQLSIVSLAKGLEQETGLRPSEVLAEALGGPERIYVLSGPSHAEEVARGLPTTVVLAGEDGSALRALQEGLSTQDFRIYRNQDKVGVELCGALKNVMALAAGVADGLGCGDNTKAAIVTRGIVEMVRFGKACGADERTFYGLAGVGDLAVTAFSRHGRNRAFGERIGKGLSLEQALAASPKVAEGVWTSKILAERAHELQVEMPIADAVARVLFFHLPAQDAVRALMERDPKAEG